MKSSSTALRTTPRRLTANRRGVSLVETLVALSLFAVSAAAVGDFLRHQIRMASNNNLTGTAYSLAEKELEDIRALDYDDIVSRSSTKLLGSVTYALATTAEPNVPAANMKRITVNVTWQEPLGTKNVTVYAIYTDIKR